MRARSRYGRYDGGPDPLAPPVDLAEALVRRVDEVAEIPRAVRAGTEVRRVDP